MLSTFTTDPLKWLAEAAVDGRGARWISPNELCVYDAAIGRALLKNDEGRLIEHSDFFGSIKIALAPRSAQIEVARECHALVQRHVKTIDFAAHIAALGERSDWPRAGNALLLEMMRPVLAASHRSPRLHAMLENVVASRILSRHEPPKTRLRRVVDRFHYIRALQKEEAASNPDEPPDDILGVLLRIRHRMSEEALLHLYAAFTFALVGSVGFAFGWSVLLAIRHGKTGSPPAHIVREALRLYPVAWLLERRPAAAVEILGERVSPSQAILISPFAIHRNPAYWDDPTAFRPERWQGRIERTAWLPFGAGSQSCIAASLAIEVTSALLEALFQHPVAIDGGDGPPSIGPALAPPLFTLLKAERVRLARAG